VMLMVLEKVRDDLIQKIEAAFADRLSGKELTKYLKELPLADSRYRSKHGYFMQKLEVFFRGRTWKEMSSVEGLVYRFTDVDHADTISDEALVYYLPAFLTMVINDPSWLIHYGILEQRIIGILSKFSLAQLDVLIAYADFMMRDEYENSHNDPFSTLRQPIIASFEDFKKHILAYLDEMGSLLKRREDRQVKRDDQAE
jgi:hypothetical protein